MSSDVIYCTDKKYDDEFTDNVFGMQYNQLAMKLQVIYLPQCNYPQ